MRILAFAIFTIVISSGISAQTADFIVDNTSTCSNQTLTFTDQSSGNIVSWLWDFGDGTTSTDQNPMKIYPNTNTSASTMYSVSLTVMDDMGSTNTLTRTDYVRVSDFESDFILNPPVGCATPHTVFFTDMSTFPDTWFWDFGDGTTSTLQNPVHNYTTAGEFTVTLTVVDTIFSCVDIATSSVNVLLADFTSAGAGGGDDFENQFGCGPLTVAYENLSIGSIDSYLWDFGDGNTSTEENPTHIYNSSGNFSVSLTVSSAGGGCSAMENKASYVTVIGPDVNFGADTLMGIEELEVNFMDSTIFSAPIVAWNWDFGDGATSNLQNPIHTYTEVGTYDVSLTVIDLDGCMRTFIRPAYISVELMPAAVPTMGTWGIIISAMLMLIGGSAYMRQQLNESAVASNV